MELTKVTEQIYYIANVTNIGVIKTDAGAILIDSGLDDNTAKKILRCLESNNLNVIAIINTHSHADHFGANAYIKKKTGASIYAPEHESPMIEFPYLESFFLFGGADPIRDLQNKFLMAESCGVDHVIKTSEAQIEIHGAVFDVVPLPGHAVNQIGIAFNGVLFCADSVISPEVLAKHKIGFCVNIERLRQTLQSLRTSQYQYYIPSHANPTEEITELIELNLKSIDHIEKILLSIIRESKTTTQIFKECMDTLELEVKTPQQYYLTQTAVMAFLSSLRNRDLIQLEIIDNLPIWRCIGRLNN